MIYYILFKQIPYKSNDLVLNKEYDIVNIAKVKVRRHTIDCRIPFPLLLNGLNVFLQPRQILIAADGRTVHIDWDVTMHVTIIFDTEIC